MAGVTSPDTYGHGGASGAIRSLSDGQGPKRVVAVCDEPTNLASWLWGGVLGLLSAALLLVMILPSLSLGELVWGTELATVAACLIPAWMLSTWAFTKCTGDLLLVSRRACATGALEFLVLGLWFRADGLAGAASQGAQLSAQSELVLSQQLAGTPATVGLWICLLGWLACRALAAPRQPARLSA